MSHTNEENILYCMIAYNGSGLFSKTGTWSEMSIVRCIPDDADFNNTLMVRILGPPTHFTKNYVVVRSLLDSGLC